MTKFFRENNKKLLAIFGVVLMIAFVLPSGMKQFSGGQRQLVAYLNGGKKVYSTDLGRAKAQWGILEHSLLLMPQRAGEPTMSVAQAPANGRSPDLRMLANQVQAHPEIYFLLQQEAENMGIRVSPQQAEQFARSQQNLAVRLPNGAAVDLDHVTDLQYKAEIIDAFASFMRVQQALARVSDVVK